MTTQLSTGRANVGPIVVYPARSIVTLDPSNPVATHVAVAQGRIVSVGSIDDVSAWGPHTIDDRFEDSIIVPGFIEAHAHLIAGAIWEFPYVGRYPQRDPKGNLHPGAETLPALLDNLRAYEKELPIGEPLIAWGLDPIYYPGERLIAAHLDSVSASRPMFIAHASLHLATVNSAALEQAGLLAAGVALPPGVVLDMQGRPNGELQEPPAMMMVPYFERFIRALSSADAAEPFGKLAAQAGITTVTDLGSAALTSKGSAGKLRALATDSSLKVRIVPYCTPGLGDDKAAPSALAGSFKALRAELGGRHLDPKRRIHVGGVKLVIDGSIQGYTAVVKWPGYVNGAPNGHWLIAPDQVAAFVLALHRERINVHAHCNGDAASDAFIDAVEAALLDVAWLDHRHTMQHAQLLAPAQLRRMGRLGMCANLFVNHVWFWGDQHHAQTVGPDRANRIDSVANAIRAGVSTSIHSDAPVTPLGPLHTMWCAVNRVTPTGRVLGPYDCISAEQALRAVTIEAAFQLHLDHEIGSIEVGKVADFTVLSDNPLAVDPQMLREITVRATVLAGIPMTP